MNMYRVALLNKLSKNGSDSDKSRELLGLGGTSSWEFYVSIFLIFLFVLVLAVFCLFLVLTCLRRRRDSRDPDKEAQSSAYRAEDTGSNFGTLRGLLSRDLWSRASKNTGPEMKKTFPVVESAAQPKYAELPTGDAASKPMHQTNLDDIADLPDMESYYEEEEEDDQTVRPSKHNLEYPHATKV